MAKTVREAALSLGALLAIGALTFSGLLTNLTSLEGINYTYSGDVFCEAGKECAVYFNITTSKYKICFEESKPSQTAYVYVNGTIKKSTVEKSNAVLFQKSSGSNTLYVDMKKVSLNGLSWFVPNGTKWRSIKSGDCWAVGKINKNKIVAINKDPIEELKIELFSDFSPGFKAVEKWSFYEEACFRERLHEGCRTNFGGDFRNDDLVGNSVFCDNGIIQGKKYNLTGEFLRSCEKNPSLN